MAINEELLDQLIAGYQKPEDLIGENGLLKQVTDAVTEEVWLWQNRPLEEIYPIVYLDVVRIKVKHNGQIITKAVYLAIAVTMEGIEEILDMWAAETEGAKFWLAILSELKNRGVKDILIALRRWSERFSRGNRGSISSSPGTVVHCPSGSP